MRNMTEKNIYVEYTRGVQNSEGIVTATRFSANQHIDYGDEQCLSARNTIPMSDVATNVAGHQSKH